MPVNRPEDKGERLSRLQRLQQRHREIGKILRDAISDDVDDGFDASTHTIAEHHLAAPLSSSGKQPHHHHHASEPIEDIVTGDEFNDQLATGAAPTSVASARSESYNGSSRPPSAGPMPMIGGSFRSAVHDDAARPATVDMSPVKQNVARRSSNSAAAASITSNPLVASHPEEQFLERQLGRTLVPTRHSNNSNTATSTRQKYDVPVERGAHPAATAASSQHGGGRTPQQLAADEATPLSTPRQNRRVEEEEGRNQHDDAHQLPSSSPRRNHDSIPLTEALLRSLPLFQNLEEEVLKLQQQVQQKDILITALHKKTEALARNLVKALKERNQFEEELTLRPAATSASQQGGRAEATTTATTNTTSASIPLSDTGMYSRAWGGSGSKLMAPDDAHDQHQHRHLMDELRLKEVELERCYAELDRLVATTHLTSSATALRGESAQLHELQRDVAMFTSSLRSVESQRDRLAAELRLSAACIENLDQRLLLSERELLQARLALAAKQTLHDGEPTPSKTENGGPLDIVALPLAARMHLARLSAEISALQSQLAQMQQDEQRRAAFDRDVQEELKHHNASLEDQLTDLMSKLAGEMERHEGTRQSYEALEATLAELHHSAIVVARLIKTSKTDVDGVVEVAAGRFDTASGHPTTSVTVLDVLRPFALQVGRDLSAVSQLLVLVRESAAKHGVKTEIVDDDIVVRQVDPTVAAPRSIKPPQHSKQTSAAPAAGAPPAKRRILLAPSVSSRQSSQDSVASGLRSTGLGWQRAGAPTALAARSLERSPSPAYPTH